MACTMCRNEGSQPNMPTIVITILSWARDNWKLLATIFLIAGIWLHGDYYGRTHEKVRWVAIFDKAQKEAQERYDAQSATLTAALINYEAEHAKNLASDADIDERVKNEIAANPVYASCHVGENFVKAYNQLLVR